MYAADSSGKRGEFCAWDPFQKKKVWAIQEDFPVWSGTFATAGDVVWNFWNPFFGGSERYFIYRMIRLTDITPARFSKGPPVPLDQYPPPQWYPKDHFGKPAP